MADLVDVEDCTARGPCRRPCAPTYGPANLRGLEKGRTLLWCTCGLSSKQPWCDGSHAGTGFMPLRWTVPKDQEMYAICACKYTESPPFCDGTHIHLPLKMLQAQRECKQDHSTVVKLCTACGYTPPKQDANQTQEKQETPNTSDQKEK